MYDMASKYLSDGFKQEELLASIPTVNREELCYLSWKLRVSKAYMIYIQNQDLSAFLLINQALDNYKVTSAQDYQHLINICFKCANIGAKDQIAWLQLSLDAIEIGGGLFNSKQFESLEVLIFT